MITAEITMGDDHSTYVHAETIEEVLQKIKEYHTMGDFERQHYLTKGTLEEALESGWYVTDSDND